MKWFRFLIMGILVSLVMSACAESGDPSQTTQDYFKALTENNVDKLRQLTCADREAEAITRADSFKSMSPELQGMTCKKDGEDGDYTLIACEGKIVTTYNGETREWPLGTYRLLEEDGEWKMCGEAG